MSLSGFFLMTNAPDDWACMRYVLKVLHLNPTRTELVGKMKEWSDWTEAMASSVAQGYVARGREWGLIERRQISGRYSLTPFGEEVWQQYCGSQSPVEVPR